MPRITPCASRAVSPRTRERHRERAPASHDALERPHRGTPRRRLFAFLRELLKINPMYANLNIAGADGMVYASAIPSAPFSIAERDYFRDAVKNGDFTVGDYLMSRTAKRMVCCTAHTRSCREGGCVRCSWRRSM